MKTKRCSTFIFSLVCIAVFSQETKVDSVKAKWQCKPNFLAGFDLLNAGLSPFIKRKVFQGFISSEIRRDIYAIAEAGFERNVYQKGGYDATVNGPFLKLGANYMLVRDPENSLNGLYAGAKLGASFYRQQYRAVPIRGYTGADEFSSFPAATESSYWLEASLGGRVQLFKSKFYVDVNMQPRYLLFTTKQEKIFPMIVPGFGKSSAKFNMGFAWNLAYSF